MKKMKLFLGVSILAMGMSMSVSAATGTAEIKGTDTAGTGTVTWTDNKNTHDIDIQGTVVREDLYQVNLNWGAMEFTYNVGDWNTTSHTWENGGWNTAGFDKTNNKISLVNNSSQPVFAGFSTAITHANIKGGNAAMSIFRDLAYTVGADGAADTVNFTNSIADGAVTDTYPNDKANEIYIKGGEDSGVGTDANAITRDVYLNITGTPNNKARLDKTSIGTVTVTITSAVTPVVTP